MPADYKKLFCFGYGYSCEYLGHALSQLPGDWRLAGTTRDEGRCRNLRTRDVRAYLFDRTNPLPDIDYILKDVTHLLISIPPDDDGDPAFLTHGNDIAALKHLEWVGYLSTTGVYGDREGRWVDENSDINPTSRRGNRRKKAEDQWLSLYHTHDLPVHIFRLAGIYGPGRSALDSVRAGIGRRIHKKGHAFGRIHVEDIVGGLLKSFQQPTPGEIYNLTDDTPAPSHEVITYACRLLGVDPPPMVEFEDANLAPMTRSFYSENRRVHNDKIKRDLDMEFKYPDYKAGLRGCLEIEKLFAAHGGGSDHHDDDGDRSIDIPAIFKR